MTELLHKRASGRNRVPRTLAGAAAAFGIVSYRLGMNQSNGLPWFERMDEAASLAAAMGTMISLFPVVFEHVRLFVLRIPTLFAVALFAGGTVRVACNFASGGADWDFGIGRVVELAVGASIGIALVGLFQRRPRAGVLAHG